MNSIIDQRNCRDKKLSKDVNLKIKRRSVKNSITTCLPRRFVYHLGKNKKRKISELLDLYIKGSIRWNPNLCRCRHYMDFYYKYNQYLPLIPPSIRNSQYRYEYFEEVTKNIKEDINRKTQKFWKEKSQEDELVGRYRIENIQDLLYKMITE